MKARLQYLSFIAVFFALCNCSGPKKKKSVKTQKTAQTEKSTTKENSKKAKKNKVGKKQKGKIYIQEAVVDISVPPSQFFDLEDWALRIPSDINHNGRADYVSETALSQENYTDEFFHCSKDSGMVFKCPIKGFKTLRDTAYTQVELREMLRSGDTRIKANGPNGNNWVFQNSPDIEKAAGFDGRLSGTLAINRVTSTGDLPQIGRIIIAEIHARDKEPLRLHYRKLPDHYLGSLYFEHQSNINDEVEWHDLIGVRSKPTHEPEDGIGLHERFSFEILVLGETLKVSVLRPNKPVVEKTIDLSLSGYDVADEFMYFKVGVLNQNNTGDPTDFSQATFYGLKNEHRQYEIELNTP